MKTRSSRQCSATLLVVTSVLLSACGGSDKAEQAARVQAAKTAGPQGFAQVAPTTLADANRLAHQATFGPNEAMVAAIQASGPAAWIKSQMTLTDKGAQYTSGGDDAIDRDHRHGEAFCKTPPHDTPDCYVIYRTAQPLMEDFFRNATTRDDQIHQRAALALQHIFVISAENIQRTYGMRNYFNALMDNALGNYRDVMRRVAMSPVMGDYLNNVNNNKLAPNENFARELLQLFSLGPCQLELGGTLPGGTCQPVYDNAMVRSYAFALTGWTYPKGSSSHRNCGPEGANCQFYSGDMVVMPAIHDANQRTLLSGITVPAGTKAPKALELVLDSIMAHPNIAPFVAKRMIQDMVVSNPSPDYVARVATVFNTGQFSSDGVSFGSGLKGDMQAVIAATLLDAEARARAAGTPSRSQGFLRDPILFFTGTLRGLNGKSDARNMGDWGSRLHEEVFRPPSVFDFYPPDYPVVGTKLIGPQFGIHNANAALDRLNFLDFLLFKGGAKAVKKDPDSIGTQIDDTAFVATAPDAGALVDRISLLAYGHTLPAVTRQPVINAVAHWDSTNAPDGKWLHKRVGTAAYLIFGSPDYEVQR